MIQPQKYLVKIRVACDTSLLIRNIGLIQSTLQSRNICKKLPSVPGKFLQFFAFKQKHQLSGVMTPEPENCSLGGVQSNNLEQPFNVHICI